MEFRPVFFFFLLLFFFFCMGVCVLAYVFVLFHMMVLFVQHIKMTKAFTLEMSQQFTLFY